MLQTALDIHEILDKPEIKKISNYRGFYFEKARTIFQAFKRYNPDNLVQACEELLWKIHEYQREEVKMLKAFSPESTHHKLLRLIIQLVSYTDAHFLKILNGNDYEDERTIARTNNSFGIWLKHLLKYKQFGNQLSAIQAQSIKSAVAYLEDPVHNINIPFEKHRQLIAENLLQHTYNQETFLEELKNFFHGEDIFPASADNYTFLLNKILYTSELKEIWQDRKKVEKEEVRHPRNIIEHIHAYIRGKGFFYSKQEIANFYLSLKTKPFVILAGISGTGKTQLARKFAEAIGAKDRCLLIPVKPDWTDNSDLIGYTDLNGNFRAKPFLKFLLRAHQHPNQSFFVILDEMNLARVEHYFSDFLSALETREWTEKQIVTEPILSKDVIGESIHIPLKIANIYIPENLFIIGTVNMDETTHSFSRKVLDRANSIEMNEVYLDWMEEMEEISPLKNVGNTFLKSPFLQAKDLGEDDKAKLKAYMIMLMHINRILQQADLHFGYRIRDEIAFYMLNRYEIREAISENEAMDYQIMQKILPRIHGSSRRISSLIIDLIRFLARNQHLNADMYAEEVANKLTQSQMRFYPKSIKKLLFMYRRLEEDGFTSFWI